MNEMMLLVIFLLIFFGAGILLRINVAFSLGLASLGLLFFAGVQVINIAAPSFSALDSFPLLAIPFFMLAGTVMEHGGISSSLVGWIDAFVGRVRGAIGAITVLASMAFGVLTGSAMATISSIGKMMHPEMVRRGYTPEYAGALIAATCFLGILIPPSIPGIMYALSSGQSISDVWLSTVGPGVLIGIAYIIYNYFSGGKKDKSVADTKGVLEYFAKIGHKTWSASPAIIMPIIIFGGIYGGVFTPTEAGAVCMAYGVGFYLVKRALKKDSVSSSMWLIFLTGGLATATICIIQIFANTASRAISLAGITQALAEFIVANVSATWQYLLICNVIFLILGCLIDITSAVLMMTPLLLPTTLAMGIDPIHFGGIMLVNLSIGFMTPPFAGGLFVACKISQVPYIKLVRECIPFLIIGICVVIITTFVPDIVLFLPKLLATS